MMHGPINIRFKVCNIAAILWLQFMAPVMLIDFGNVNLRAVANMAVSLMSCSPSVLFRYFLNDSGMVPFVRIIIGITSKGIYKRKKIIKNC